MIKPYSRKTHKHTEGFSLFRFIQETAVIGSWEFDLMTNKVSWSHVTKQIHEVEPDYIPTVENGIQFYKKGYSRDTIEALFRNCIEKSEQFDIELQIVTAKGRNKWVRVIGIAEVKNGIPYRVCGAFQDINDKTRAAKKMALKEEQFRKTFEFAGIGMALVSLKGKWIKVNKSLCQMLGYSKEQLLSFSYNEITHYDDFDISTRALKDLNCGKLEALQIEKRFIHKSGAVVYTYLSISLVKNDAGKPMHYVYQINDISKIKKAQLDIKNLLEVSEKQNKRLLNFAHIVSHNLRSHYSNLDMLLELMQMDEPASTRNDIFPLIKDAVLHLGETVDNLNEVAILKTNSVAKITSINLCDAINKSIASIKALAIINNAKIETDIESDIYVKAVPAYIDSIILNLLTNAIKYKSPHRQLQLLISAKQDNNEILLEIKDNGLGIDLALHGDKIFGMYKTFHKHKDSRGLGLFITKNQIDAIDGDIRVESTVNEGTSFIITLKS